MVGCYEIRQGDKSLGTVRVEKQGLYYRFSCRCSLTGEVMHRLVVVTDGGKTDLGVCVPMEGAFGVEKRIPCKQIGTGTPEFQLLPKHEQMKGQFVPVYPEEPFSYMARLKDTYLATRDGQIGVVITE